MRTLRTIVLAAALVAPALTSAEDVAAPGRATGAARAALASVSPVHASAAVVDALPPPPPPPPPPDLLADLPPPVVRAAAWPRLGLLLDAGVPDGVAAALAYRALPSLRVSLGGAWNGVGYGVQGGAGWTPLRWIVSPSLNLEAGHFFAADLRELAGRSADVPEGMAPLLARVGYRYATAQLGLELGSQRGFSFFLRAGLSYLEVKLRGTGSTAEGEPGETEVTFKNPTLRATMPSAKVGFLLWF